MRTSMRERTGYLMRGRTWTLSAVLLLAAAAVAAGLAPSNMRFPTALAAQSDLTTSEARSMSFGGRERAFRIHVPSLRDWVTPVPLVFVLHGGGGTGEGMERLTLGGFNQLADRDGFVVVYPDGVERHWNDGRGNQQYRAQRENVDDVGFFAALIGHLSQTLPIDRRRVYATGISNGGLMSLRLSRELADRIAAIAPVAASMSEQITQMRDPARPIAVLLIAGTKDPLVPYGGGEIGFERGRKVGRVVSVPETIRYWVTFNQCPPGPVVAMEPDRDPQDVTRVRREAHGPCREGTEVILYAIEGGGHTWPGGQQYLPARIVGRTSKDIDANEVIWSFFKRHGLR